jgi:hypothetical protein
MTLSDKRLKRHEHALAIHLPGFEELGTLDACHLYLHYPDYRKLGLPSARNVHLQ